MKVLDLRKTNNDVWEETWMDEDGNKYSQIACEPVIGTHKPKWNSTQLQKELVKIIKQWQKENPGKKL